MAEQENGYVCFYYGSRVEVYAKSSLEARDKAYDKLRAARAGRMSVRRTGITVMLAEKNGQSVIHSTTELPGS